MVAHREFLPLDVLDVGDRIEEWLNGDYCDTPDSRVDGFFCQILYDRWLDADPAACPARDNASRQVHEIRRLQSPEEAQRWAGTR